ncbi:MAG: Asp-tRNA(Asn)/Glu-tRNA(Gln) amidotransferase subunit GatC [Patescibacteria group bacterium]
MDKEKVLNLAKLARIEMGDEEAEKLSHEFDAILDYVGEVKKISTTNNQRPTTNNFPIRNIMRADDNPHESGVYTEKILNEAPAREGNYFKVKKIL